MKRQNRLSCTYVVDYAEKDSLKEDDRTVNIFHRKTDVKNESIWRQELIQSYIFKINFTENT